MVYWVACYKDGKTIKQDESLNYDSLDRENLEAFVLMYGQQNILTVWLDDGRQLIWRLRREIKPGVGEILWMETKTPACRLNSLGRGVGGLMILPVLT